MDEDITRAVEEISGRRGRDCYFDLCCVVSLALPYLPGTFKMQALYAKAEFLCQKDKRAIGQSVIRASRDCWEYGDRERLQRLFRRVLVERPEPKELVRELARSVWEQRRQRPRAYYSILDSINPEKYGYVGRIQGEAAQFLVPPFCEDKERVERLVRRLNREGVPLSRVVEFVQEGDCFCGEKEC